MNISYKKIFQFLYGPFFAVIDFFMIQYRTNRDRLNRFLSITKISVFFQGLAILILILWLFTFTFAPPESRNQLTEEIQQNMQKLKALRE